MSETFTLDTTGAVDDPHGWGLLYWSDLTPFAQGYVEGLICDVIASYGTMFWARFPGFSDLHPETLAAILKDCAKAVDYQSIPFGRWFNPNIEGGRLFWADRAAKRFGKNFPPLTPYLGDDGRVRLRQAETSEAALRPAMPRDEKPPPAAGSEG